MVEMGWIMFLRALAVSAALSLSATVASAVTVNCPGTSATTDREFSLTTSTASACLRYGTGNINGNTNAGNLNGLDPLLNPNDPLYLGSGYALIDKSDVGGSRIALTGLGGGSGSWSFALPTAPTGFSWANLVFALKSGVGQLSPTWAAFSLPAGVTGGTWAISRQGLSHANLYGQLADVPAPVPLPAAGLLLAGGLGGLAALRRRKA